MGHVQIRELLLLILKIDLSGIYFHLRYYQYYHSWLITHVHVLQLQVRDVKLRLHQVEIEMAKLRSKQIEIEKDGKTKLLMNHGTESSLIGFVPILIMIMQ